MSDLTPLEKLHVAIDEYVTGLDDHEEGSVLSGFVMVWQETKIIADSRFLPLTSSSDFVMGPGTTLELAIGLNAVLGSKLENELWADDDDEGDD